MADEDYWKRQYQSTWGQSSQRETSIAATLFTATGKQVQPVGFGAGSAEFFSGSASSHGHAKGDADLQVVGTAIHLEVTGPLVKSVDEKQALWIRPDKVANARGALGKRETWVLHHLPKNDLVRAVPLDDAFFKALDAGDFPIDTPTIRGVRERYHAIPANHPCVKSLDDLVRRLQNA